MKYIILLLITFNTYAQFKVEINPTDSKYAKMQINCSDQDECDSKLLDWINKQQFFKGVWNADAIGSIATRQGEDELEYFHASNFSIEQKDISAELAEQALEAAISKKIACGESAIKFIAKNNVKKQLSVEQRRTMVSTYSSILDLLKAGSVDIAKVDIQAVTADGTIVTEQDKTDIVNFITECE